ncbi:hypothetical protein, partial [[Kitasatospora] papulosa]
TGADPVDEPFPDGPVAHPYGPAGSASPDRAGETTEGPVTVLRPLPSVPDPGDTVPGARG